MWLCKQLADPCSWLEGKDYTCLELVCGGACGPNPCFTIRLARLVKEEELEDVIELAFFEIASYPCCSYNCRRQDDEWPTNLIMRFNLQSALKECGTLSFCGSLKLDQTYVIATSPNICCYDWPTVLDALDEFGIGICDIIQELIPSHPDILGPCCACIMDKLEQQFLDHCAAIGAQQCSKEEE
jgi:hypothetical protein